VTGLGAHEILRLWELGIDQHPAERALTLVAPARPDLDRGGLAHMTVGERDRLLLELRERTFGPALNAVVHCPRCGEALEFTTSTARLRGSQPSGPAPTVLVEHDGVAVQLRPVDGDDLLALAACADTATAEARLLERCVLSARRGDEELAAAALPPSVVSALEARLAELDPAADLLLGLSCPACQHGWQAPLDVAGFFWTEVAVAARRLLLDVARLAASYHWSERDILAMSPQRRKFYLEQVES
jgi:hypothetical protein